MSLVSSGRPFLPNMAANNQVPRSALVKSRSSWPSVRPVLAVALVALLLLVAAAPQAQAAINRPRGFHEAFPYMAGLDQGEMIVVSGEVEASVTSGVGSYGFFDSQGLTVSGLTQACYAPVGCRAATSLVVPAGGSAALCFPTPSSGEFEAGHVLGLFVDLTQDDDLNSFPVDKSLIAPAVDGKFHFTSINRITSPLPTTSPCTSQGGLAALDDTTQVIVRNGESTVTTLTGKNARVGFTGQPSVSDVVADFYIVPFNGGAEASFDRASESDARQGLDLASVQDLIRKLDQAHANSNVERGESDSGGNNTQALLAGILNGALLRLPDTPSDGESLSLDGSHFVRFSSLDVQGTSGALDWDGKAYIEVKDGKVKDAPNLVGFWLFQLPWWSYVLWAAALTLAIVRFILKPDKNHPRWDNFRWIGWVATFVAWALVFILWDFEMHGAFGASLFRDSSGQFKLILGLLQVLLLAVASFAAAAPLRVIFRNSSMLAHQGTFMGLAGGASAILGFLFTAPYLRSFLGVILAQVMDRLG